MHTKALSWFKRGNKAIRLIKILGVAAVLYVLEFILVFIAKIPILITTLVIIVGVFGWMKFQQVQSLRLAGMDEIDKMNEDGTKFEERIALLFRDLGWYDVHTTKKSGDFGADVVAKIPGMYRIVAQCKCYGEGKTVGLDAVQEAVAAIRMYKAQSAMVITNRHLTENAKKLALVNDVVVWEREQLANSLASVARRKPSIINDLRSIPSNKLRRELRIIWEQSGKFCATMVKAFERALK